METQEKQRPVISNRDRSLSISIFKKDQIDNEGHLRTYYSACLQRSYQKPEDKGTDKWQRENINLYPDELLKLSVLALKTYNDTTSYAQANRKDYLPKEHPAQSFDDTPPAWVEEDIPFGA